MTPDTIPFPFAPFVFPTEETTADDRVKKE